MIYLCNKCHGFFRRDSHKRWIKSFCTATGKDARLYRQAMSKNLEAVLSDIAFGPAFLARPRAKQALKDFFGGGEELATKQTPCVTDDSINRKPSPALPRLIPKTKNRKRKKVMKTKILRIEVTKDDIEQGIQGDGSCCAVARAIEAMGFFAPIVDERDILFSCEKEGTYWQAETPKRAGKWIVKFDENKKNVRPFKFRLKAQTDDL